MSTWNVITITEAPRLTERKLDKAIDRAGLDLDEQTVDETEDGWKIYGHSKYEAEGIFEIAADLTRRHPGSRVEVFQEWDCHNADEPGQSLDVYSGGERQPQQSRENGLVPVDLHESIRAVRAAITSGIGLVNAARWLVDGLDGTR